MLTGIRPVTGGCCGGGLLLPALAASTSLPPPLDPAAARPSTPLAPSGTLVVRAKVVTVDADSTVAEAFAVRDGRIIAVGSADEVVAAAGPDAEVVDRPDAVVLPGFIEPHAHILPTALFGSWNDLGALRFDAVTDVLAHLGALAADHPADGSWLLGRQFDPSLQAGPDALTIDLLDQVSTEIPIAIVNASMHFAYVNSAALHIAGVTAETPDIDGSPYGRDPDGRPNGVLKGQGAMLSVMAHNPGLAQTDLVQGGLAVTKRAASVGVTTIADQGVGMLLGPADIELLQQMMATGELSTRVRYSVMSSDAEAFDAAGVEPGGGDAMVRATGWKIVSDGSNQGRTGHQREPYLGTDDCGLAYVEPSDLTSQVRDRAAAGWQVVVHANGDRAIDDTLAAYSALDEADRAGRRHRIEHCSILHDEQIAEIAALDLSPSFLIGHVHYWGQAFRDEIIGAERADLLDRTASCTAAGITWTIHSDEMVTAMEPLRCIENAVTRTMWREPDTVLAPAERVSAGQAVRSMTSDAAWQCHSDHEIGSIEVGKMADFVVLDADPHAVDPSAIHGIAVQETWLGGRQVWP